MNPDMDANTDTKADRMDIQCAGVTLAKVCKVYLPQAYIYFHAEPN